MCRCGFWLLVFMICLLGLLGFWFITIAALADAQYRCPGIQCSDAHGSALLGIGVSTLCGVLIWLSVKRIKGVPNA